MTDNAAERVTHEPVLLNEVLEFLSVLSMQQASVILDGTLGLGGYSEAILKAFPNSRVIGVDRDTNAIAFAEKRLIPFGPRFTAVHANFSDIVHVMGVAQTGSFNACVLDLGVSNMQLTESERGFSFQHDGPLDMRMDTSKGMTAADVLAQTDEQELARIFWEYGDERWARKIAAGIVADRKQRRASREPAKADGIKTTGELVALIRDILPEPVQRKMGGHPARRVFQALRIFVNDELSELESVLAELPKFAASGCVVIVVSYHSLEDRIVKHRFRSWEKENNLGKVLTRHPVLPQQDEIDRNYKARSAKLRAFKFS